jgi:capsular polysaccharide export protein
MRQCDLAPRMTSAFCDGAATRSPAPGGSGLLSVGGSQPEAAMAAALLPDFRIERWLRDTDRDRLIGVLIWSGARNESRERRRAARLGIPFLRLGHGLLRVPPERGRANPLLSATAHELTGPNSPADVLDPGRLLLTRGWEGSALLARAASARRDIISRRLAGPWWNLGLASQLPRRDGFALILTGANGSRSAPLSAMLSAAMAENPPDQIALLASNAEGQLGAPPSFAREAAAQGCIVLIRPADLWEAIQRAGAVYTAGGEAGFLALLAGAKVHCFAECFYSGWGVTTDAADISQKPFARTIEEIFAGACLIATRYLDPFHNTATSLEGTLELVDEWRKIEAANRRIAVCLGMSFWKRRQVADFLRSSAGAPAFRRTAKAALAKARSQSGGAIAVWAARAPDGLAKVAEDQGIPLIRVEDGFIRSVGLGSDFMPAASLVLDKRGMHFDPSVRSDLELLLVETEFDTALIERAHRLAAQLVARGVTKYNLGKPTGAIERPAGRRRILVPGQVEDDLSVRLGGSGITSNLDLLRRVRAANPDAFIAYKPHPDVEAGHRRGRIPDDVAIGFADTIIRDVSTASLLAEIDELHTLTSLVGFEALLRGRRVVVYGKPFYAGWGLTTDLAAIDRGRRLTLEELVAGALILYPRYLDPVTRLPCGPEIVIERLDNPELWRPGPLVVARRLQGVLIQRWNELVGRLGMLPTSPLPQTGRDDSRTPQP